jgi:hypothetical protein
MAGIAAGILHCTIIMSTHIGRGLGVLNKSECLQISITNSKPNGASSVSILNTTI